MEFRRAYTDGISRKRSLTGLAKSTPDPSPTFPSQTCPWGPVRPRLAVRRQHHPSRRRDPQFLPTGSSPGFMSIVEEDTKMLGAEDGVSDSARLVKEAHASADLGPPTDLDHQYSTQLQHRGSTSTCASESTDSSPTTTISTADSSSITEPSPSSSPESPITIVPLSSFKSRNFTTQSTEDFPMSPPLSPFSNYIAPSSPGKKPRNTKNLSLALHAPSRPTPSRSLQIKTVLATDGSMPQSAPPSPSFIVPPKPQRKRPSNLGLTIKTPAAGGAPASGLDRLRIVPPTPSATRPHMLRHHQSSPALSIFVPKPPTQHSNEPSPNEPQPAAGFARPRHPPNLFPRTTSDRAPSIPENPSPVVEKTVDRLSEELDIDVPLSQEQKSPAYPSGPVCIYDPHVYLYLEPSRAEACEFDVILNVAREVLNPFKRSASTSEIETTTRLPNEAKSLEMVTEDVPEPDTAVSMASFQTAFESQPSEVVSPTTPKATVAAPPREPEYIHIPWDHNTNIVDDLLNIVEIIDERVRQGKKILVHCQCGVSRSASLIVAYGMYKNPSLTVQEAYDAVKARSRWIGPNMSLIYQLSEFREKLIKRSTMHAGSGFRSFRGGSTNNNLGLSNTGRSNTIPNGSPASRPFLAVDTFHPPNQEPQTAPLPEDRDRTPVRSNHLSPISPSNGSSDHRGDITPGPSSAPSGLSWLPAMSTRLLSDITSSNLLHNPPAKQPTATAMAPPPLPQSDIKRQEVTMREPDEVPPTPCLWSPRAIEFTANPFGQLDPPPAPSSTTHGSRIGAIAPPPSNIQPSLYPQSREAIMTDAPSSTDYTPPTPGLWSPRATEFTVNPFGSMAPPPRPAAPATSTAAHAPGTHSVSADDPRSPAYRGEAPITRSIFDVL